MVGLPKWVSPCSSNREYGVPTLFLLSYLVVTSRESFISPVLAIRIVRPFMSLFIYVITPIYHFYLISISHFFPTHTYKQHCKRFKAEQPSCILTGDLPHETPTSRDTYLYELLWAVFELTKMILCVKPVDVCLVSAALLSYKPSIDPSVPILPTPSEVKDPTKNI